MNIGFRFDIDETIAQPKTNLRMSIPPATSSLAVSSFRFPGPACSDG